VINKQSQLNFHTNEGGGFEILATHLPFFFADPKLMECSKTGEDATAQPASVSPLDGVTGCMDLGLFCSQLVISSVDLALEKKEIKKGRKNRFFLIGRVIGRWREQCKNNRDPRTSRPLWASVHVHSTQLVVEDRWKYLSVVK
jgi:hypothetical protein